MYDFTPIIAAVTSVFGSALTLIDTSTMIGGLIAATVVGAIILTFVGVAVGIARKRR